MLAIPKLSEAMLLDMVISVAVSGLLLSGIFLLQCGKRVSAKTGRSAPAKKTLLFGKRTKLAAAVTSTEHSSRTKDSTMLPPSASQEGKRLKEDKTQEVPETPSVGLKLSESGEPKCKNKPCSKREVSKASLKPECTQNTDKGARADNRDKPYSPRLETDRTQKSVSIKIMDEDDTNDGVEELPTDMNKSE